MAHLLDGAHAGEALDGGTCIVELVLAAELLAIGVPDASHLEHNTHCAARNDAGSWPPRPQHDLRPGCRAGAMHPLS